jgi:hypothetical protein
MSDRDGRPIRKRPMETMHAGFLRKAPTMTLFEAILVSRRRRLAMKTFIIALMLFFALASGISMIVLAFRADFGELAADNAGNR